MKACDINVVNALRLTFALMVACHVLLRQTACIQDWWDVLEHELTALLQSQKWAQAQVCSLRPLFSVH